MAFLLWLVLILAGGFLAERKGRSVPGWVLLGIFLAPITFIILLVLPDRQDALELRAIEQKKMKKCDECAELVRAEARKCRYCGHFFKVEENKVEKKALPPAKAVVIPSPLPYFGILLALVITVGTLSFFVKDPSVAEMPSAARYTPSGTMIIEKCVEHFNSLSNPNVRFCEPYFQRWPERYISHGRRTARNREINGVERATTENAAQWGSLVLINAIEQDVDSNLVRSR